MSEPLRMRCPRRFERAVWREMPEEMKRAGDLEKTVDDERAVQGETPVEPKRAVVPEMTA